MNAGGLTVSSVQRQLREDWDNREYGQVVADNVKHIADFLSNFVIKRRNPKLMATSRITKFASGASAIAREVTPIVSSSREQARASVLAVYKEL
ncbi:hypothetical protein Tcan_10915 [Toxocara canis]|uniref:Uncharacterized protein n=1 Tax=Toxocara canis TaxID=6265 RepID=A0A0B2VHV4_TOXCA|nr:hypothetical protein Tcan_10915 [Toxocara canis]